MPRQTFEIGMISGVRLGVHVSWIAVYLFVAFALSRALPMLPLPESLAFGALAALALFASVVVHEFAHALTARRFGIRTSAITLFLFGGVATIDDEAPTPRAEALVALAGPAASIVLGLIAAGALLVTERLVPGRAGTALGLLSAYLAIANGVLAAFNLVPAYPMDGGRVLRAVLWRRGGDRDAATRGAARLGIGFAIALIAAGIALAVVAHNALYGWYAVLGGFVLRQGRAELRSAQPVVVVPNVEVERAA